MTPFPAFLGLSFCAAFLGESRSSTPTIFTGPASSSVAIAVHAALSCEPWVFSRPSCQSESASQCRALSTAHLQAPKRIDGKQVLHHLRLCANSFSGSPTQRGILVLGHPGIQRRRFNWQRRAMLSRVLKKFRALDMHMCLVAWLY